MGISLFYSNVINGFQQTRQQETIKRHPHQHHQHVQHDIQHRKHEQTTEATPGVDDVDEVAMKKILGTLSKDRDYLEKFLGANGLYNCMLPM